MFVLSLSIFIIQYSITILFINRLVLTLILWCMEIIAMIKLILVIYKYYYGGQYEKTDCTITVPADNIGRMHEEK